jgi:ABC-type branched-subunit amino acid transport system ATPase component
MDILNALSAFLNVVFVPGVAYGAQLAQGYVLVQGSNRFSDTGKALMADPEVRRSFLG